MNSKERVRTALNHQQPDRCPADFACVPEVWEKMKNHFNCSSNDEVLNALNIDFRVVEPTYIGPPLKSYVINGDSVDEHWFGWKSRWHWNGYQRDNIIFDFPLDAAATAEEILAYQWPNPDWFDYASVQAQCRQYEGLAILTGHAGVYQFGTFMRDAAKIFLEMAMTPEIPRAIFAKLNEFELAFYDRILTAADGAVDVLRIYDDYGTQSGTFFSVSMWRDFFADNTRKLADLAHSHGAFLMQHSCGAISSLIPELMACGVNALDPIQKVPGMEIERLKKEFGDRLTFHGGIDTQHLLPNASPEEVSRETAYFMEVLNKNGGYILAGSQDYLADTPIENLLAIYQTPRN